MGHYAVVCPEKKKKGKNQNMATSAEVEDFLESFDWEFGFIACESTSAGSSAMKGERECAFSSTSVASSSIGMLTVGFYVI